MKNQTKNLCEQHIEETLAALNSYTGDNIWEDVIYRLPRFNGALTDHINPIGAPRNDDMFSADFVNYRNDPRQGWIVDSGTPMPSLDLVTHAVQPWAGETWSNADGLLTPKPGTYCELDGSHTFVSGVCANCGITY